MVQLDMVDFVRDNRLGMNSQSDTGSTLKRTAGRDGQEANLTLSD
jgi:hypothetical protein